MDLIDAVEPLVIALGARLRARAERLVSAESCTGGLLAAACTSVAGSSDWFERGYVTYSNAAKSQALGVPAALIDAHGAVSEEVVRSMAAGALARSEAQWSIAVTGIAGPGGATVGKPVGLVWLAWAGPQGITADRLQLDGGRTAVREQTVRHALQRLLAAT